MCGRSGSSGVLEVEPEGLPLVVLLFVEVSSLGLRDGTKWGRESSSLPTMTAGAAECWVSLGGGGVDAERVVVGTAALVNDVARRVQVETADSVAGVLDGVDVAGLECERDGMGEEDASVFVVVVDEDGDGNEARGVGLEHVAGPLVDADGAGDALRFFDVVHLGGEGEREDPGAESADEAHGC
jgi:hypothetical protein